MKESGLQRWQNSLQENLLAINDYQDLCKFFTYKNFQVMDLLAICKSKATPQLREQLSLKTKEISGIIGYLSNDSDEFVKKMTKLGLLKQCKSEFGNLLRTLQVSDVLQGSRIEVDQSIKKRAFSAIVLPRCQERQQTQQTTTQQAIQLETEEAQTQQKYTKNKSQEKPPKKLKRPKLQFTLKKELKNSNFRYECVKAGRGLEQILQVKLVRDQQTNQLPLDADSRQLMKQFENKRERMQRIIQQTISHPNPYQVSFEKKYQNLGEYFGAKKQLIQLYSGDTLLQNLLIQKRQIAKNQKPINPPTRQHQIYIPKVSHTPWSSNQESHQTGGASSAFLTDLTVKARIVKRSIRRKIDQVIQDVKTQLVQHFHKTRTNRFNELNSDQLIELVPSNTQHAKSVLRKKQEPILKMRTMSSSASSRRSLAQYNQNKFKYEGVSREGSAGDSRKKSASRISTAYQTHRTVFWNKNLPEQPETHEELGIKFKKFMFN